MARKEKKMSWESLQHSAASILRIRRQDCGAERMPDMKERTTGVGEVTCPSSKPASQVAEEDKWTSTDILEGTRIDRMAVQEEGVIEHTLFQVCQRV